MHCLLLYIYKRKISDFLCVQFKTECKLLVLLFIQKEKIVHLFDIFVVLIRFDTFWLLDLLCLLFIGRSLLEINGMLFCIDTCELVF